MYSLYNIFSKNKLVKSNSTYAKTCFLDQGRFSYWLSIFGLKANSYKVSYIYTLLSNDLFTNRNKKKMTDLL